MCGMDKPSFIPSLVIRYLRDLVRYLGKLTNMIICEKNIAHRTASPCPTSSSNDVFSNVFGKCARSITDHILAHPGETYDVAFFDQRCNTPISEIQAAVDDIFSHERAVELHQCLDHIDELEEHHSKIKAEINCLVSPFTTTLDLIHTVPGFNRDTLTAIIVVSEIGVDMSVLPSSKNLVSWVGYCPRNGKSNKASSPRASPRRVLA